MAVLLVAMQHSPSWLLRFGQVWNCIKMSIRIFITIFIQRFSLSTQYDMEVHSPMLIRTWKNAFYVIHTYFSCEIEVHTFLLSMLSDRQWI